MSAFLTRKLASSVGSFAKYSQAGLLSVRHLNLLEYQSKELLKDSGVSVQNFTIVDDLQKTDSALDKFHASEYVIKSQVLAGGRGKGWFDNGFKGGVHLTKDRKEVKEIVKKMLGHKLITKQTTKDGILVQKVMIAESVDIKRETYLCILMDRSHNGPVLIASPAGGVDIEAVAEKTPEAVKTIPLNIYYGIDDKIAKEVAEFLGFTEETIKQKAIFELKNLWKLFVDIDALQIEINPFVETEDQQVVAVDAKIAFDDNAQFRQKDIFALEDLSEKDPREIDASRHNLNYVSMDGNIGCLDPKAKAIFVNIFGGIVNCAIIAKGLVTGAKQLKINKPVVVRLQGTNMMEARKILQEYGAPFTMNNELDEAARNVVATIRV
ncbi:hypothetical protein G9C98_003472 [Cotesia typhae]|uniref:Uncharacterized protein n=1 Tax=Cotesia typhae TaxID=2053667 RepID=A0A8J5UVB8_9HYME|nr:hypothetical protein G9C98_003472 [Cotesia typhae]